LPEAYQNTHGIIVLLPNYNQKKLDIKIKEFTKKKCLPISLHEYCHEIVYMFTLVTSTTSQIDVIERQLKDVSFIHIYIAHVTVNFGEGNSIQISHGYLGDSIKILHVLLGNM
jgi:hypothetical protein